MSPARKSNVRNPYSIQAEDDEGTLLEPGEWLEIEMKKRDISDADLLRGLQSLGYEGGSRTIVFQWRKGRTSIPAEIFPKICHALGFPLHKTAYLTCEVLKQAFPELKEFIRNPLEEQGERVLRKQALLHLRQQEQALLRSLHEGRNSSSSAVTNETKGE